MNLDDYRNSEGYARVMRLCIDDLIYFFNLVMPQAKELPTPAYHRDFADDATDLDLKHGVYEAFRESAKSSIFAQALPLWHRYCEPCKRAGFYPRTFAEYQRFMQENAGPGKPAAPTFVVLLSKSQAEAKRRLRSIALVLGARKTSKRGSAKGRSNFVAHFGSHAEGITGGISKNQTEELLFEDGTIFISKGGKQQGHGLQEDFVRPTLLVNDDYETEENTKTPDALSGNFDMFMNGFFAGLSPSRGRCYTLATPTVEGCMVRVLRDMCPNKGGMMPKWRYRHVPFLVEDATSPSGYRSNWPEKMSVEDLLAEKAGFEAQGKVHLFYQKRQCELRGRENQLFRETDIMLYEGRLEQRKGNAYLIVTHMSAYSDRHLHGGGAMKLDEPEIVPVNLFGGLDGASGAGGDDAVLLTRAYDNTGTTAYDGRHFVVDMKASNTAATPEQVEWVFTAHKQMPHQYFCVEGAFFDESLKAEMQARSTMRGQWLPVQKVSPRTSKGKRYVNEIVGPFRSRKVFLKKEHAKLIDQLLGFRADSANNKDDAIDGFWLSTKQNWPPSHTAAMFDAQEPERSEYQKHLVMLGNRADTGKDWRVI